MNAALYMAPSGAWDLGVKIGLPLAVLGALVILVWLAISILYVVTEEYDRVPAALSTAAAAAVLLLYVGGMLWAFWPLDSAYHQYRDVSGTVRQISSRFVSAGDQGGTNQKFVVVLNGSSRPFGVEDTRAALLHRGDPVHLRCIRVWDYGSTNAGYDCKWGGA